MFQKLRTLTLTNGSIKNLDAEYEQLNIRGAVSIHQEVHLKKVSTHGHSSFYFPVTTQTFNSTGSCTLKDYCEMDELTNAGNLKIRTGRVRKIHSTGKLVVEEKMQCQLFEAIGIVKAVEIQATDVHLKLSGESEIGRLMAETILIEKDKVTLLPLFKKKLSCQTINGRHLQLSYTKAEVVDGEVVVVGENCQIETLYYSDEYTIAPTAKVHHVIRREKE
ncbi:hypothetical protein [Lysinibacillus cavernae]|uniref:hypothetical protein n=1 Tax=Lysinibacillus cavernae TaxID=2666135 RepID=UPI0012D89609|nr:hypothetical protein [Lysinibacillus cavernae]